HHVRQSEPHLPAIIPVQRGGRSEVSPGREPRGDGVRQVPLPAVAPTDALDSTGHPLKESNLGKGRSYGIEMLLRRQIMKGFYGWVAYTLSRTTRLDDPTLMTGGYHLYDFDQTHILTVIASYQTEHNWTFGTRLRYTSGDPYTPFVNGIFNANNARSEC